METTQAETDLLFIKRKVRKLTARWKGDFEDFLDDALEAYVRALPKLQSSIEDRTRQLVTIIRNACFNCARNKSREEKEDGMKRTGFYDPKKESYEDYIRRVRGNTRFIKAKEPEPYEEEVDIDKEGLDIEMATQSEALKRSLAQLSPVQRQVVGMRVLEHKKWIEIAAAVGRPLGSVNNVYDRTIIKLRKLMSRIPQEPIMTNRQEAGVA